MNRINIEFFKFLVFLILTILFLIMCITLGIYYYLWVVSIFALLTGLFFGNIDILKIGMIKIKTEKIYNL